MKLRRTHVFQNPSVGFKTTPGFLGNVQFPLRFCQENQIDFRQRIRM